MSELSLGQRLAPKASRQLERAPPRVRAFIAIIALLITLTAILTMVVGDENPGAALSPALVVTLLYAVWKVPLRYTLFVLMFCVLTLENPYLPLAFGLYQSPIAPLGAVLLGNLNLTTGVEALHFTGLDCITAYLFFVVIYRQTTGSRIDRCAETAKPLGFFAWLALLSIVAIWAHGMLLGGSFSDSLWQAQKLAYVPVMFLLFHAALRGAQDYGAFARALVAAALVRSVAAILIRAYFQAPQGIELQTATSHADSLLFASAFAVVVASFWERPTRQRLLLCFVVLPVLFWGMVANTRRLVWVELAGILIAFFLITPWTRFKRTLTQAVVAALPLLLAYVAVGWNSHSRLFTPVQVMRSITQPETDSSSEWREHENFNLLYNIARHPLLGSGFGHEYVEYWSLPDISNVYGQYRYNPHNSLLGLLNSAGLVGFTGYWMLLLAAIFLAVRSYHRTRIPGERAAALSSIGIVIVYIAQAYGDVGLAEWNAVLILAPALAIVGKLAVLTGAWPAKRRALPADPIFADQGARAISA